MTGEALFQRAMQLINYTDPRGHIDRSQTAELFQRGLTMVNTLLADVMPIEGKKIQQIQRLEDELPVCEDTAIAVMPYGLAMLLAQSEGDGDNQQLMAMTYNQKRCGIHRPGNRMVDGLPWPEQ